MPSQISSGEDKAKQATEARKLELEHRLQKIRAEKPQIQGGNNGKDNNSNETAVVGKPRRRLSARDKKRELEHMFLDKTDKSCPSFDESSHSQSKNDLSKSQHSHSILKRRSSVASCTTLEKGGSDHSILNRRSSFTGAATTTKHHDRNATTKSCVSFADDSVGEIRPQLLLERKHASFRQDTNMDLTSKSCGSLTRKHSVQRSTSAPSRGNVQRSRSHPNLGRHQLQLQRSSSSRRNLVHPPSRRLSSSQHHPDASRRSARSMQSAIEEAKPAVAKSLVLIWVLMACELGFDLGTTVIAFMALTEDDDCCGYELTSLSMAVIITTPFLLLVCAELVLLTRIITQTMYRTVNVPSHGSDVFLDNISDMESEEFGSFYDSDQEDRKDDDVTAKITTKEHDPETGGLKQQEMRKAGDDTGGSISLIGKDPTFSSKNISPSNRQTKSSSACSGFVSQDDGIALNDQVSVKKQAKLKQEVTVPDMNQVKEGNVIVQTKQSEEETAKESTASDVQKDQEKLDTHAATIQSSSSNDVVRKSFCTPCCGCWDIEIVFRYLEILVLLNPFFECFIVWILLYQSDNGEAFLVVGLESGALMLHYFQVALIGTIVDVPTFLLHGFVPLAPVLTSVGLAFYYLQQGGVCYTVSSQRFGFTGCELCDDGYPPIDGMCHLKNGTSVPFEKHALISLYNTRLNQTTYCAADHPEGPQNVNFCFFGYSGGSTLDKDEEDFAVLSPTKDPSQFLEYVVNQP